ncbi:hypothetical protein HK100_011892 [Physocladia obscura]|uniref:Uncharacterized protein n=1 Tax=Physocladia obscura TaxID=109957 RepID=A0AAD5T0J8_9FUNG|nr:hypothetical protein HK100_011892 [Physocladia obscura]
MASHSEKPRMNTFSVSATAADKRAHNTFAELVERHNISDFMAEKLHKLEAFDIVIVADDTVSMQSKCMGDPRSPFNASTTHWQELKETIATIAEIATVLNNSLGMDVYFLHRPPIRNLTGPGSGLNTAFTNQPSEHASPLTHTLRTILREKCVGEHPKKLLILIATASHPTTPAGHPDLESLKRVLSHDRRRISISGEKEKYSIPAVCFLTCTNGDAPEIEYLEDIRGVDVVNDYYTEKRQVRAVQGRKFAFSRGDWICRMILGFLCTYM